MKFLRTKLKWILLFLLVLMSFVVCVLFDYNDICLDTGYCKEGLKVNTEYGDVVISKKACKEHNWVWRSKCRDCVIGK